MTTNVFCRPNQKPGRWYTVFSCDHLAGEPSLIRHHCYHHHRELLSVVSSVELFTEKRKRGSSSVLSLLTWGPWMKISPTNNSRSLDGGRAGGGGGFIQKVSGFPAKGAEQAFLLPCSFFSSSSLSLFVSILAGMYVTYSSTVSYGTVPYRIVPHRTAPDKGSPCPFYIATVHPPLPSPSLFDAVVHM